MQFNSWAEFWAMGGYGFYVWLSFGIAALVMTGIICQSWLAHKQLIRHIAAEQKRKQQQLGGQSHRTASYISG